MRESGSEGTGVAPPRQDGDGAGMQADEMHASVQNYYGKVLKDTSDLKTSACCAAGAPPLLVRKALEKVPDEVIAKFYGCGSPVPYGIEGLRVLDLGSGSGRDCYVAAAFTGPKGRVTGVDMTDEQLEVARKHVGAYTKLLGYAQPNLSFVKGQIEDLRAAGIADASVDLVISNCVVNLSPDKPAVLREAYRVLADGGEFYFSDVYCDRRLPEVVRKHEVLVGECLGGALYIEDFKRICHSVGFTDPRVLESAPIEVKDPELSDLLGEAKFFSITYRLFKLPGLLETLCEDYGQVAYYLGTIPGHKFKYALDDHHVLEKGRPMLVCGNSAAMLENSWLRPHFKVIGDRSVHYGLFDCSPTAPKAQAVAAACGPGGCC
eukprot:jgi/Mesvir1/780/Mv17379-RA.1